MERQKYISLVAELRQIVVAKALTLLDDHDAAEDEMMAMVNEFENM